MSTEIFALKLFDCTGKELPTKIKKISYNDNIKTINVEVDGALDGFSREEIFHLQELVRNRIDYGTDVIEAKLNIKLYDKLEEILHD